MFRVQKDLGFATKTQSAIFHTECAKVSSMISCPCFERCICVVATVCRCTDEYTGDHCEAHVEEESEYEIPPNDSMHCHIYLAITLCFMCATTGAGVLLFCMA